MLVDNNLKYSKKKKALLIDSGIIGKKDFKTEGEVFELAYLSAKKEAIHNVENSKEYKYITHVLKFACSDKVFGKVMTELDKYIHRTLEKSFQNKNFNKKVNFNHYINLVDTIYELYVELYKEGYYNRLSMEGLNINTVHKVANYLKLCKDYKDLSDDKFDVVLEIKRYK